MNLIGIIKIMIIAPTRKKSRKRLISIILLIFFAIMLVVGGSYYFLYTHRSSDKNTSTNGNKPSINASEIVHQSIINKEKPEYQTVLPEGKTIESLGGWARVSPPSSDPVFAYADKIGDKPITVSEQLIPESFKPNVADQVQALAKSYDANQRLTFGDTTVYIGTSAKGPQSVIFTKRDLLILIKSTVVISNEQWAAYVISLK